MLEAERFGGDVSELVTFLNNGLGYLSGAKRAFSLEVYDGVIILAVEVVEVLNVVVDDAIVLKGFEEHYTEIAFRNRYFWSFGAVFFTFLFVFWVEKV